MIIETRKTDGLLVKKAYKEVLDEEAKTDKKTKIRYEIEKDVFDLRDSVADNAKLISLMFAMSIAIYNVLPDEIKNNIPENVREKIDFAIKKFNSIKTWGDIQLEKEGTEAIEKLLDRQAKIGEIISKNY